MATLSLHSLLELRCCLQGGTVLLDADAPGFPNIVNLAIDDWVNRGAVTEYQREQIIEILLKRHRHQHERRSHKESASHAGMGDRHHSGLRSLAEMGRNISHSLFHHNDNHHSNTPASIVAAEQNKLGLPDSNGVSSSPSTLASEAVLADSAANAEKHRANQQFMKKIPPDSEAANILIGEVDFLQRPIYAYIRLQKPAMLGDMTEVDVKSRYVFILLGPRGGLARYHEIGRAVGTIMSDEIFHMVAFKARTRKDLLAGVDEFLDAVTVLPPGEWDPNIRIEPPDKVPSQEGRMNKGGKDAKPPGEPEHGGDPWLQYSGR